MRCSKCGVENREAARFCDGCGSPLQLQCVSCGALNRLGARFCDGCGASLIGSAPLAASTSDVGVRLRTDIAAEELDGERKTVTALFADIKGSMELMEDLDPEEARAIVDPALKLMIEAVRRYGGYIVQSTGDGIFALFGAPIAHEDHPQRGLYAALRLQEEMRRYSAQLRQAGNLPVEARVGVNTGDVVVRSIATSEHHPEYTPIGHSTSLAARMQALAPTGSIAVTDSTRKLCEGYFAFRTLGPTRVKGVSEPLEVFEVTGLGPLKTRLQVAARRGLTKFVGREHEMESLRHAAETVKHGHGQIVAAMADPGVGKSRLFYEFKATSQSGWMLLETLSVSHGKASAYMPVIDLLHAYFDIKAEDDGRKRREKVAGKIAILDRALEDTLPYLFGVLGLVEDDERWAPADGEIRRRRTVEAIKRIILRESLNQPLMIVFEDLHWIDSESQALLNLLADSIGTARILLMVNYRPEYRHEWGNKTYYTQLRLDPLGRESADEMLTALLGSGIELESLKQLIVDKTEGNPFFMEEIVQGLFEEGALIRNGKVGLARPLDTFQIPLTVQAMLAARIDRLPADEKELLQTSAVLGKEFRLGHLKATASKKDEELERALSDLQLGEFIYEQPAAGDVEYTFKHALTQEVAYNSILSDRRKALHERAGQALEVLFAPQLGDHLDGLARHYARSGNLEKAAEYLRLAGLRAASRSAFTQAITQLKEGLELLRKLPANHRTLGEELATHIGLTATLLDYQGPGFLAEVENSALRARAIAGELGDYDALLRAMHVLRLFYRFRQENEKSRLFAEETLATAQAYLPEAAGVAHFGLGETLLFLGEFEQALYHYEQARSSGKSVTNALNFDARALILAECALALWILGRPAQAADLSRQALPMARSDGSVHLILVVLWFSGLLHQWSGDSTNTMKEAEELLQLSNLRGSTTFSASAAGLHGWAQAKEGRVRDGLLEMRRAVAAHAEIGWSSTLGWGALAEIYSMAGETSVGLKLIEKALEQVSRTGERIWEAELHRLKGALLLTESSENCAQAEQCFRKAVEIAQRQKAKSWELRATLSLARLLAQQGRRDEARLMLSETYSWFTEGLDTADLKEARALLDELSP